MIFIFDQKGNSKATIPSGSLHQGSNLADEIIVLAPISPSSVVTMSARLPNGLYIYPALAKNGENPLALEKLKTDKVLRDPAGMVYSAFRILVPASMTQYAGILTMQFTFTMANIAETDENGVTLISKGQTVTTEAITLVVEPGTPTLAPKYTESNFSDITKYLNAALSAKNNAEASATNAAKSKDAAELSAAAAETSATNAAESEKVALFCKKAAETAEKSALKSELNAEACSNISIVNAKKAVKSAASATESAASATESATNAAESAASAAESAASAAESAASAAESATNAAESAASAAVGTANAEMKKELEKKRDILNVSIDSGEWVYTASYRKPNDFRQAFVDPIQHTIPIRTEYGTIKGNSAQSANEYVNLAQMQKAIAEGCGDATKEDLAKKRDLVEPAKVNGLQRLYSVTALTETGGGVQGYISATASPGGVNVVVIKNPNGQVALTEQVGENARVPGDIDAISKGYADANYERAVTPTNDGKHILTTVKDGDSVTKKTERLSISPATFTIVQRTGDGQIELPNQIEVGKAPSGNQAISKSYFDVYGLSYQGMLEDCVIKFNDGTIDGVGAGVVVLDDVGGGHFNQTAVPIDAVEIMGDLVWSVTPAGGGVVRRTWNNHIVIGDQISEAEMGEGPLDTEALALGYADARYAKKADGVPVIEMTGFSEGTTSGSVPEAIQTALTDHPYTVILFDGRYYTAATANGTYLYTGFENGAFIKKALVIDKENMTWILHTEDNT